MNGRPGGLTRLLPLAALLLLPCGHGLLLLRVRAAHGPFWLGRNYDPDYTYLLNALRLARLEGVSHTDHPGTTLQILGAAAIRIRHAVRGGGALEADVLEGAEGYLSFLHASLLAAYLAALAAAGFLARAATGRLAPALLLQASPFLSGQPLKAAFRHVSPEILLLVLALALASSLPFALRGDAARRPGRFAALLALLCGAAAATKFTAAPLALLPLIILPDTRSRLRFLAGTAGAFALLTLPAWPRFPAMAAWLGAVLLHPGRYGDYGSGFSPSAPYLENLAGIARGEPALSAALALGALALGGIALSRRRGDPIPPGLACAGRLLLGLVAAQAAGVLIVAKQPVRYYLMPVLGLTGATLWIALEALGLLLASRRPWQALVSPLALVLCLAVGLREMRKARSALAEMEAQRDEALSLWARLPGEFSRCARASYEGSSSPAHALLWSDEFAGRRFADRVRALHPDAYLYDLWKREFRDASGPVPLEGIRRRHGCVLLGGPPFDRGGYKRLAPPFPIREVSGGPPGRGRWETLYLVP